MVVWGGRGGKGDGELHCTDATMLNEYRKYIEKDLALERRLQQECRKCVGESGEKG